MISEPPIHVLLVEDSPSDVLLAKDALEGDMGFHVAVTDRLSRTLDLLKERTFDIVLLDLGLPDSQGLNTLLRLRESNPTVPVVVMTASDDEELALRAIREGAQDYLIKTQVFEGMLARLIRYAIERKQAEVSLEKARDELELRVQQRTGELTKAIQVRDRFLATMSHELRTPLNAIIGFTEVLLMLIPGPLTPEQEDQLSIVERSAKHLLSLINDLLDLAKIESGKVEVHLESVPMQCIVEEVTATLRPLAAGKDLGLEVTINAPDVSVMGDRRALTQILTNLISNAIKFTDTGSVMIELDQRSDNGQLLTEIRVLDTGIGISPEDQARLFQPFHQVVSSGKVRQQGTGLGLNLSRGLAELMGGSITVQSEYGKGSAFTLVFRQR